jgi:hypothetical protein
MIRFIVWSLANRAIAQQVVGAKPVTMTIESNEIQA